MQNHKYNYIFAAKVIQIFDIRKYLMQKMQIYLIFHVYIIKIRFMLPFRTHFCHFISVYGRRVR